MMLLASFVLAGVVLTVWFTGRPYLDRYLTVLERQAPVFPPAEPVRVPMDVMLHVTGYSEGWPRDQALQRAKELYAESGDWNAVRAVLNGEQ